MNLPFNLHNAEYICVCSRTVCLPLSIEHPTAECRLPSANSNAIHKSIQYVLNVLLHWFLHQNEQRKVFSGSMLAKTLCNFVRSTAFVIITNQLSFITCCWFGWYLCCFATMFQHQTDPADVFGEKWLQRDVRKCYEGGWVEI